MLCRSTNNVRETMGTDVFTMMQQSEGLKQTARLVYQTALMEGG